MRGNPILRPASVHPFHRSGAITDDPRPERRQENEQQLEQTDDGGQAPAPSAQARQQELAAELANFLWKRQEPGLDQSPLSGNGEQGPGIWRDQLLAEIEGLAATLKEKVARYSLTQAPWPSEQAAEPANETAVLWIQDALEDIAATALGIEIASRELFIHAGSDGERDSKRGADHEQTAGTAE